MSLALARHLQTVEVCCKSFAKDMKTIEAIACSTKDPELRERLLREFESLQKQLSLCPDDSIEREALDAGDRQRSRPP